MDKEKHLLDCSQELGLDYKEKSTCLTFWCTEDIQKTYTYIKITSLFTTLKGAISLDTENMTKLPLLLDPLLLPLFHFCLLLVICSAAFTYLCGSVYLVGLLCFVSRGWLCGDFGCGFLLLFCLLCWVFLFGLGVCVWFFFSAVVVLVLVLRLKGHNALT